MKTCSRCKRDKTLDEFHERAVWCKACVKEYDAERWKTRDKEAHKRRKREHRIETMRWMDELKASLPCADCGITWPPYVSDWDHRPGTEKLGNISDFVRSGRRTRAESEMKKCDLVCANCHRIRTHERNEV